jgi:hypothetical protein
VEQEGTIDRGEVVSIDILVLIAWILFPIQLFIFLCEPWKKIRKYRTSEKSRARDRNFTGGAEK